MTSSSGKVSNERPNLTFKYDLVVGDVYVVRPYYHTDGPWGKAVIKYVGPAATNDTRVVVKYLDLEGGVHSLYEYDFRYIFLPLGHA